MWLLLILTTQEAERAKDVDPNMLATLASAAAIIAALIAVVAGGWKLLLPWMQRQLAQPQADAKAVRQELQQNGNSHNPVTMKDEMRRTMETTERIDRNLEQVEQSLNSLHKRQERSEARMDSMDDRLNALVDQNVRQGRNHRRGAGDD